MRRRALYPRLDRPTLWTSKGRRPVLFQWPFRAEVEAIRPSGGTALQPIVVERISRDYESASADDPDREALCQNFSDDTHDSYTPAHLGNPSAAM